MSLPEELLTKYGQQVPRYTSYPTAPHFKNDVVALQHGGLISACGEAPLSLYFHIPFCEKLCWYCGCSMKVVNQYSPIERYILALIEEIKLVRQALGTKREVAHIHFGGGTPTMMEPADIQNLFEAIYENFEVMEDAEIAVEGDPRTMSQAKAEAYAEVGVNRMSFGLQDFAENVQEAINRVQPFDEVKQVIDQCRLAGIDQINIDMMYGLPLQTVENFTRSMEMALLLDPERVALFGYAHVPWMKKHMELIKGDELPSSQLRMELFNLAAKMLADKDYVAVGLDHFVKSSDPMGKAFDEAKLNRNFQGYTVDQAKDLIALGASAISFFEGRGYTQNAVSTKAYEEAVAGGAFATYRGVEMTKQDAIQADVIKAVMCYYEVNLENIAVQHDVDISQIECDEDKLVALQEDGVITREAGRIVIPDDMRLLVRVVASCFDSYFTASQKRHSAAV